MKFLKNKLVFSQDKKSVHILFENGKESICFNTKEEAYGAIIECHKKGKISDVEIIHFLKEIFSEKNLAWVDTEITTVIVVPQMAKRANPQMN